MHWQQHDRKILQRINRLINEIRRDPLAGIGKPEPLRHALTVYWSRRVSTGKGMLMPSTSFCRSKRRRLSSIATT